jgi:hypothetical protein
MLKPLGLLVSLSILIAFIPLGNSYEIQYIDDKVFIDDENVYLSAQPHTLYSSGEVVFEFLSKKFTGNIDIAFGYDREEVKPKNLWLLPNNSQTWIKREVHVDPIQYNFHNLTTWYIFQNIPIEKGKLYMAKVYLDIPFPGLNESSGEYYFAVKPSAETIHQAVTNGHFYYLDPWWNVSWSKRVPIYISDYYFNTPVNNFPVGINISSTIGGACKANGDDLRFTLDDNTTLLNYEIDTWNPAGTSLVWVNVTYIDANNPTLIWLYYGNAGATRGQNPYGTWDGNYLCVLHCSNAYELYDSTQHNRNFTIGNVGTNATGAWGGAILFDGDNDYYHTGSAGAFNFSTQDFMIEVFTNQPARDANYRHYVSKGKAGSLCRMTFFSGSSTSLRDIRGDVVDAADKGAYPLAGNGLYGYNNWWHYNSMRYDATNLILEMDGNLFAAVKATAGIGTLDVAAHSFTVGSTYAGNANWMEGSLDEIRISTNTSRNETWRNATFANWNASNFTTFGSSETYVSYIAWSINQPLNQTNMDGCCLYFNFSLKSEFNYLMNITIYSNMSGNWLPIDYSLRNVQGGEHSYLVQNFTKGNTTYYWNASIDDGNSCNNTGIYWFHTNSSACGGGEPISVISYAWVAGIAVVFGCLPVVWRRRKK